MKILVIQILGILLLSGLLNCQAQRHHTFVVQDTAYTRLCSTKNILTVNGLFPGPTLYVTKGETIIVDVINKANYNITIHWHGVNQPRNPWSDGPEYITQCPIRPGQKFIQKIIFSTEEGTLWWHAHSAWSRATVHGAIVIKPKLGTTYPFPNPHAEVPIILGEWWKKDIVEVYDGFHKSGGNPILSDAYTINGQPGDLYNCSKNETFKLTVEYGKTYLLRMVNAAVEEVLFFAIAKHQLTMVGIDGSYTKPLKLDYITISPGQTMDVLLEANQPFDERYYMAAKVYSNISGAPFDATIATAIVEYKVNRNNVRISRKTPLLPSLPASNDTNASINIISQLKSLADEEHPIHVPLNIDTQLFFVVSVNAIPCGNNSDPSTCQGPQGNSRLSANMNSVSFKLPSGNNILSAYYRNISGVYKEDFPNSPPLVFDFTAHNQTTVETVTVATQVKVLEYDSTVELVLQGTNLLSGTEHPIHLHGHRFYVVGWGFGNFDKDKDPSNYNLVDPPYQNTISIPKNGWTVVRFRANNPGVWFMHCHLERHTTWGMAMTFIVKDGKGSEEKMLPPPKDMPKC